MIGVDTNILVYASRDDNPFHEKAHQRLRGLCEGGEPWVLSWHCAHEFLAIVTNPKIFRPPTPLDLALRQLELWMSSPSVIVAGELPDYLEQFGALCRAANIAGGQVYDARVAAVCMSHGAREMLTNDRDFERFQGISVVPL
jgi:uncharacterized protein